MRSTSCVELQIANKPENRVSLGVAAGLTGFFSRELPEQRTRAFIYELPTASSSFDSEYEQLSAGAAAT